MTPVTLEKGEDCPQDQSQGTSSRKPSRYSQAHLLSPGPCDPDSDLPF